MAQLAAGVVITTVAQRDGRAKPLTAPTLPCVVERDAEAGRSAEAGRANLTLTLPLSLTLTKPACCQVPLRRDGRPRSKRLVNVYLHKDACPCTQGEAVRP